MNSMMQLIHQNKLAQTRPSTIVPDLVAKCSYCENPFNVEHHEFCPYCFTDAFDTFIHHVFSEEGAPMK